MEVKAIIYIITCQDTSKQYVGQTINFKKKGNKLYKYGISQRLVEHFGAAKRDRTTPLAKDIRKFGIESFSIEEIERCNIELSDEKESFHIRKHKTLVPNGYNVQRHSRVSKGLTFHDTNIILAEIKGIKKANRVCKVRVLLTLENEKDKRRFMFGTDTKNFKKSLEEAKEFCEKVRAKRIVLHSSLTESEDLWWPYKEKIDSLDGFEISRIRATKFRKTMVRVHIRTPEMTSYKQEKLLTFGGKTIPMENAMKIAFEVIEELKNRHPGVIIKIENNLK